MTFSSKEQPEVTLLKDREWRVIDGEPCRVIDFTPLASVKNGKVMALDKTTPYASITIECKMLPKKIQAFITHKVDFIHLWAAFKERGIKEGEEVVIIWTAKHYKNRLYKIFSVFMPKIWVMICPRGALELMVDSNWKPELTGVERAKAMLPIIDWEPEVMQ